MWNFTDGFYPTEILNESKCHFDICWDRELSVITTLDSMYHITVNTVGQIIQDVSLQLVETILVAMSL